MNRKIKIYKGDALVINEKLNDRDFAVFFREKVSELLINGYRIYSDSVCESSDITNNAEKIAKAKSLIILKPAKGLGVVGLFWGVTEIFTKLLAVDVEAPVTTNRSQTSSTNSLGARENQSRVGERVEDIWGKVNYFAPSLIQYPYYVYEDNSQVENFAMACCGEIDIAAVRDGEINLKYITRAKFNAWNPSSDLNSSPDFIVGGEITERKISSFSKYEALQSQELLPPNDSDVNQGKWSVSADAGNIYLNLISSSDDSIILSDLYSVGDFIDIVDLEVITGTDTVTYYSIASSGVAAPKDFEYVSSKSDLSGSYEISSVGAKSLIVKNTSSLIFESNSVINTLYLGSDLEGEKLFFSQDPFNYNTSSDSYEKVLSVGKYQRYLSIGGLSEIVTTPIKVYEKADRVIINLVASSGFYNIVENTDKFITVDIEIIIDELDGNDEFTGNSYSIIEQFSSNSKNLTAQAALTVYLDVSRPARSIVYENSQMRIRRLTRRDKSDNVANVDKVYLDSVFFEEFVSLPNNENFTIMKVSVPSSSSALGVKSRLLNIDATRIHQPYLGDGVFGEKQPISTWAETLVGLCLDKHNGRLTLSNIDADTLLDIQDEIVEYYGTPKIAEVGYTLDSTKLRFQEIYQLFCRAVLVEPYSQGGIFKAYADIKRNESMMQFTHRFKIYGSDNRSVNFYQENDGIELTYRSNETGAFETIVKHKNGVDSSNRKSLELSGCVNSEMAEIVANRNLNILKYQRATFTFDADGIANLAPLGARVDNVDYSRIVKRPDNKNNYKIYSGNIINKNGLELELSEPVYFEGNKTHSIRLQDTKGNLMPSIACIAGRTNRHVVLQSAPAHDIYIGHKKERDTFTLATDESRSQLPVIVRSIRSKESEGIACKTLTCIDYNDNYYANDQDFKGATV